MQVRFEQWFYAESTEEQDIKHLIAKLPKSHQKLLQGYKFKFQAGNGLKGDEEHVGSNNLKTKTITVAAPFWHSRSFTLLHEIGHLVYQTLTPEQKEKWESVRKKHPCEEPQSVEEDFSMAYGTTYVKNRLSKYDIPQWISYIKSLTA